MPAFLSSLSVGEVLAIAILAVVIFGKDLPSVLTEVARHIAKLRRAVTDLKRETGIDQELRDMKRSFREASWEVDRAAREARADFEVPSLQAPMRELEAEIRRSPQDDPAAMGSTPNPNPLEPPTAESSEPGEAERGPVIPEAPRRPPAD